MHEKGPSVLPWCEAPLWYAWCEASLWYASRKLSYIIPALSWDMETEEQLPKFTRVFYNASHQEARHAEVLLWGVLYGLAKNYYRSFQRVWIVSDLEQFFWHATGRVLIFLLEDHSLPPV